MVQTKDMKLKSEVYKENQRKSCTREGGTAWWNWVASLRIQVGWCGAAMRWPAKMRVAGDT